MPEAARGARLGPRRLLRAALPRREPPAVQALPGQPPHRAQPGQRHDAGARDQRARAVHRARVARGSLARAGVHRAPRVRPAGSPDARGRRAARLGDRRARVRARAGRRSSRPQPGKSLSGSHVVRHQAQDPRLRRRQGPLRRRDRHRAHGAHGGQREDVRARLRRARSSSTIAPAPSARGRTCTRSRSSSSRRSRIAR